MSQVQVVEADGWLRWSFRFGNEPKKYYDTRLGAEEMHMAEDTLEALVGDGRARVTASTGIKDGDFGNGFEAFCTVTLTCNQDEGTVKAAQVLAGELVGEGVEELFEVAHEAYKKLGPHPQAKKEDRDDRRRR